MTGEHRTKVPTASPASEKKIPTAWQRFSVSGLEADLAYFRARMEFIGKPETINQKAQIEAFRFLHKATGKLLKRLQRKVPKRP